MRSLMTSRATKPPGLRSNLSTRMPHAVVGALLLMAGAASSALAGSVLDRIRSENAIHCGAPSRPGLLESVGEERATRGLFADLCHAVGAAIAGPGVKVEMSIYDAPDDFNRFRAGQDELVFLTGREIVDNHLSGETLPGPPVFYEGSALMVADRSPFQHVADLSGEPICFLQGDASHRHLEAFFAARRQPFIRMGYQEEIELYDAFDAQLCHAIAGEATTLAEIRLSGGTNRRSGRILSELLATFPIIAATGVQDASWSAAAFWTLSSLIGAERPKRNWAAGGLDSLPLDLRALGLSQDWRAAVTAAAGGYGDMLRRNISEGSPLKLHVEASTLAEQGGLMTPPYAE
jgi:general L-amino acid transport system substrate-binding protein